MARSVAEIKKTMTDAFLGDETLREKYGLREGATWSESFSSVSLENILLFIVAGAMYVLEVIMDKYKEEVSSKVESAVVASVPWYHKMALAFQYGDSLVLNDRTQQYGYSEVDESKQVVKYAAVRDRGTSVQILVSGDKGGNPEPLSNDVLSVFKRYMNRIKLAGVILSITSKASDHVLIKANITIDPLVLDEHGTRLTDGSKPVEAAIRNHLKNIVYGGTFNKTKLVDAIQGAPGVIDVELLECSYKADGGTAWTVLTGNNYIGNGGSYVPDDLENSLRYVVQD